jgi:hypothetical protein
MRRVAAAVVFVCVLVSSGLTASAVRAGDYYEDGYYGRRHADNVWYTSNCCYRKVVRHERSVRYVRTYDEDRSYERRGYYERPYYERPYRSSSYYNRPYRSSSYYGSPRRYDDYSYTRRRYDDYSYSYAPRRYVSDSYYGYSSYAGYSNYDKCRLRPMSNWPDGYVWSVRAVCP